MIELIKRIKRIPRDTAQFIMLISITVALMLIGELSAPGFLEPKHLSLLLESLALLGIVSIAQTLVIMTGGIDLSVGPIMYFIIALASKLMHMGFLGPFLICLAIGASVGAVNGVAIAWLGVPPIVITLGMMVMLTGATFVYTGGVSGGKAHPLVRFMAAGYVGPLHTDTVIWTLLTILFFIVLWKIAYGRKIQAIGSNPQASYSSGINVKLIQFSVYTISGLISAFAGTLLLGYLNIAYFPSRVSGLGSDYVLQSIAATVLGGTMFKGGKGGVHKTFLGTLILGALFSILTMMGLPEAGKLMAQGLIIITIVAIYVRTQR